MKNVLIILGLIFLLAACADTPGSSSDSSASTGACEGWSDTLNKGYCYDGWTESECADYDERKVNYADWYFHSGQTCSERGY
ncbi:hypothetical protein KJ966_30290 [bacterium]|nr:hypothetical protein [bacterium]